LADVLTMSRTGGPALCFVLLALEGAAGVAGAHGQPERAARLFGATDAVRTALGVPVRPVDRPRYDRDVSAVRTALGPDAFAAAWAAGRALPLEQAITEALVGCRPNNQGPAESSVAHSGRASPASEY
jgi:hypothetical protein